MTERNTILMDLDTGEWITVSNLIHADKRSDVITAEQGVICAASLMPGVTAEELGEWYLQRGAAEPEAFPVGSKVRLLATGNIGTVRHRVSSPEGELHTLAVAWQYGRLEAVGYCSPRELEVLR